MNRTKNSFLFVGFTFLFINAHAQFRKYSNEFLNIGAGARGLGMGGAQVASVNDGTSGYWNPAGLVEVKEYPILHIMHAEYFAGIGKYDYASVAIPLSDKNNLVALGNSISKAVQQRITDNTAIYKSTYVDNGVTYTYYIYMIKDEKGAWKIRGF